MAFQSFFQLNPSENDFHIKNMKLREQVQALFDFLLFLKHLFISQIFVGPPNKNIDKALES